MPKPEELTVSVCLLPVIRLLQEWVDEGRWGDVTITFQRGAPTVGGLGQTVKFPPAAASSGRTVRLTEKL